MGRCRRSRRRGRTNMPPPHSWGGVGGADGGAEPKNIAPPHSWGGVGGADGGAGPTCLLPIHGEVSAEPTEGLNRAVLNASSKVTTREIANCARPKTRI